MNLPLLEVAVTILMIVVIKLLTDPDHCGFGSKQRFVLILVGIAVSVGLCLQPR